jgi:hypothetical protein
MLIDDLPTQSDKPKKFKGGAVVNESHKKAPLAAAKIEEVSRARVIRRTSAMKQLKEGGSVTKKTMK